MAASIAGKKEENFYGMIVSPRDMQVIRDYLKPTALNKKLIIKKLNNVELLVTTTTEFICELSKMIHISDGIAKINRIPIKVLNTPQLQIEKMKTKSPYQCLVENLTVLMQRNNLWDETCKDDIPNHWEKHGNLILLPSTSFLKAKWKKCPNLWETVAKVLKCEKIGRKDVIKSDNFRSPNVELLLGSDGWITCQENGIKYTYDVTKCMFSVGNITEKLRISKLDCSNETVIDMYAGIGYFTLSYLIHANAAEVHACEWNPNAVEALRKNLNLNNVYDRCTIHYGDNRKECPVGIADRVNLGLLPSSEPGFKTACLALKPTGGFLHVHSNVETEITSNCRNYVTNFKNTNEISTNIGKLRDEWRSLATKTAERIQLLSSEIYNKSWDVTVIHVEHVKSYAPHVDHIVIDIECKLPVL